MADLIQDNAIGSAGSASSNNYAFNNIQDAITEGLQLLSETSSVISGENAGKTSGGIEDYQKLSTIFNFLQHLDFNETLKNSAVSPEGKEISYVSVNKYNKEGELTSDYGTCPVCGKKLIKKNFTGFCSRECFMKYNTDIIKGVAEDIQEAKENIGNKVKTIAKLIQSMLSFLNDLMSMLIQLTRSVLDSPYMIYFKAKINLCIIFLKKQINSMLIWKNNLLIFLLEQSKFGIDKNIDVTKAQTKSANRSIESGKKLSKSYKEKYNKAYETIQKTAAYALAPESMNFFMTPRSFTKYHKASFTNQLKSCNANSSSLDCINSEAIVNLVNKTFPALKSGDYLLPPAAFKARVAMSNYNEIAIKKYVNLLTDILKTGSEPLPVYKDLKIKNVWWMVFLLTTFGPEGQKHYAIPMTSLMIPYPA